MDDIKKIFDKIQSPKKRVKCIKNKPIVINFEEEVFDSSSLYKIMETIKPYLAKYSMLDLTVYFNMGKIIFKDKVTYIILDMIFYYIFKYTRFRIDLFLNFDLVAMHHGFKNTAIARTWDKCNRLDKATFIKEYEKHIYTKLDDNVSLYRKIIKNEEFINQKDIISRVMSDVEVVLNCKLKDEKWVDDVCNAVEELIDNIGAHTKGDCLLDIDICYSLDHSKIITNIVILNISKDRIFDQVKEKIKNKIYDKADSVYSQIYKAYDNHANYFSEKYTEDDFFNIVAFQWGVTSRYNSSGNSGTGLITSIKSIVGKTLEQISYELSGENIIMFDSEIMKSIDEESDFIGFNQTNNFINDVPDVSAINKSKLYWPGTIFNLALVRDNNE